MTNIKENLHTIKAFAFDVDGVFSDSSVLLHPSGELMRTMNIKDGYAIQLAIRKGYPVAIITGGNSESVKIRFQGLGVSDVYLRSMHKMDDLMEFCFKYDLKLEDVLYMGDDMPDYEVMTKVGFPACPADAAFEIQEISRYISSRKGGAGCVRDVMEQVMKLQGKWTDGDSFQW